MSDPIVLSEEVGAAIAARVPVVGLETSVIAQGLPPPRNLEAAGRMAGAVRSAGAVPAWVWAGDGAVRAGAAPADLERIAADAAKAARRDLPILLSRRELGATTVSAALWAAHRIGIEVVATGGIGGVHPGAGDVSADLFELARTPGTVVCSGPKSIVDPEATAERFDELGIAVLGLGTDRLPFFFVRDAGLPLEHVARDPEEAARVAASRRRLRIDSALLVCNPIPEAAALDPQEVAAAVTACSDAARRAGIGGKDLTPYLMRCLAERTAGRTLEANLILLEANATVAATIAARIARE